MRKQRRISDSFAVTAKLISAFVFATRIVQSLCFLNPKFQASSHLLWLYSLVCVGQGRKPQRQVFSRRDSYIIVPLILAEDLWMVLWVYLILTLLVLEDHWREEWPSYPRRMLLAGCTFLVFLTGVCEEKRVVI